MYKFSYDYIQPKYQDKAHLCYLDPDSFIANIKTEDVYKGIVNDDISNYIVEMLLPVGTKKKNNWINEGSIKPEDYDRSCRT